MARADSARYGVGRLGVLLSFVILGASFGIGLWFVLTSISVGMLVVLDVIVGLAGLAPLVLMLIALYRLGDEFGVNYLSLGVILSLIGAILQVVPVISIVGGILNLVGFILQLVGLNEVKRVIMSRLGRAPG
ncbi:DUF973 family protein [Vulcanisaeta sp. JCM 16159]|uniref:DUF973 family protein n=1 Tax=Vulcanisaeta sp. JCM 16159 TaxID=1295371 RepID=UPI0006D03B5E|nr:DUF973 family protein [Vulcanisaeta sp. JCM 16159]